MCALAASFSWGLIFIVPQFIPGYSSIEITLGCYLFYGLGSLLMLLTQCRASYSRSIWYKAIYFSLISTIIYYACVVLALRNSSPAICALILGINPVAISFYGNWKKKECRNRMLLIPALLILCGLIIINVPQYTATDQPLEYSLGLLSAFFGLLSWSWYVVENSRFLKDNPEVSSSDWSTIVGVATLFWAVFLGTVICLFFQDLIEIQKFLTFDYGLNSYLIGCAVLGLVCTWLAALFWNHASMILPVPLLGQLAIFETLFGLFFVYTTSMRCPMPTECIGITFF